MKDFKEGVYFREYQAIMQLYALVCYLYPVLFFSHIQFIYYNFHVVVHSIEFQKRRLPYVYILVFLEPKYKISSVGDINEVIYA